MYLNDDLKNYYSQINEAVVFGTLDSYSTNEMQKKACSKFADLTGVNRDALMDNIETVKLKSAEIDSSDNIVAELLNETIKSEVVSLFSVFERLGEFYEVSEIGEESFRFDEFSTYALSYIILCENSVLSNSDLSDTDRMMFFSTSHMLTDVLSSYEALSVFVANNFGETLKSANAGFFKKLWNGITKVASVIVTTVVSTVVNVIGSAISGSGMDGLIDNALCTIPAVFVGLYEGIVAGVECEAFDLECLTDKEKYHLFCSGLS